MGQDERKSLFFGLAAVFCWSTVASAFKLSLRYITPEELLLYSSFVSIFVLFCVLVVQRRVGLLFSMKTGDWGMAALCGAINPVFYYLILLNSYRLLPAQQAQVINYTWAITLSIFSVIFLKQKISLRQGVAIFISYFGVFIIGTGGNLASLEIQSPAGVGLALFSTLIWASYWIINTRDRRDPIAGLLMNFICGTCFIIVYILIRKTPLHFSLQGIGGGLYIGIFEMGLAFVFWLLAMKLAVNTVRIANLIFLSPVLSLFFIHFFVGEKIEMATIFGLVCILAGVGLQSSGKKVGTAEN